MPIVSLRVVRPSWIRVLPALAGLLSIAATPAYAQREQWAVRYEGFGRGGTTTPWTPGGAPSAVMLDSGITAQQVTVQGGLRRVYGKDQNLMVLHGFVARAARLGLPWPQGAVPGSSVARQPLDLYALQYDFWWLNTVSDVTTLGVIARPGLFTDGRDIGLDHFRLEGAVFVDRVVGDNTTLGFGLAYGSNFGVAIPVPVLHVVHRRGTKVLLDGFLPQRLTAWWFPRKGLDVGLEAQLFGAQYRLGDPASQPRSAGQFQFANGTVGPVLRWNLFGKTYLNVEAGTTVVRRFNFARFATGPGEAVLGYAPGNAPYVKLGLVSLY
ncbi:MAG: DUF6268 family outer membrane beta-barrel protein [Gemmatimonadota bacterium]|jgi:hypothetical protein